MGLCATAKGLTTETELYCGYIAFKQFRINLASTYNKELGELYESYQNGPNREFTDEQLKRWNEICNDDLDIFLWHPDCEGKFTPQECRRVYNVIKDMKMNMKGRSYGSDKPYNMLERWKDIFKHCADKRVTLYFQ